MAKRFTDTEKWKKAWFRKLSPLHKAFWVYLCDNCNHAGIWEVDFELAEMFLGEPLNVDEIKHIFEKQYIEIANGRKWLIKDFIDFQYGKLNPENRAHKSVIDILKKEGAYKPLKRGYQGYTVMDKDKDKDKEKDKDKDKEAFNILINNKDYIKQLEELYPNVPIEKELRKMKAWVMANPGRLKKNWKRFMVNWLNKATDQYPAGAPKGKVIETPKRDLGAQWPDPPKEFKELVNKIGKLK